MTVYTEANPQKPAWVTLNKSPWCRYCVKIGWNWYWHWWFRENSTISQNFSINIDIQFSFRDNFFSFGWIPQVSILLLTYLKRQMERQKTLSKSLLSLTYLKCFSFSFRIVFQKKLPKEINIFRPLTDYWLLA